MRDSKRELLRSKWMLKVALIYLNDFKEIICDAVLITYQLGKKVARSWITKITQLLKNAAESSVQEFKHFFDMGPVPDNFNYSFLMV